VETQEVAEGGLAKVAVKELETVMVLMEAAAMEWADMAGSAVGMAVVAGHLEGQEVVKVVVVMAVVAAAMMAAMVAAAKVVVAALEAVVMAAEDTAVVAKAVDLTEGEEVEVDKEAAEEEAPVP
jgi:hypothetical protein